MQDMKVNIMLDSVSSSNQKSMSKMSLLSSMFCSSERLNSKLSSLFLSEWDRNISFFLSLLIRLSNLSMDIGGTLLSVKMSDVIECKTLRVGRLA